MGAQSAGRDLFSGSLVVDIDRRPEPPAAFLKKAAQKTLNCDYLLF